jgi:hypothetical protein
MDLLENAGEIAMMNLSILYNTILVPLVICAPPPLRELEQQGLDAKEKLQYEYTIVLARRKK